MDSNLNSFGNSLHSFISKNQPNEANNFLTQISKEFTDTDLSSFTIDAYLLNIFNESNGITLFLTKVLHDASYKKAKVSCFTLLYTLTNNCLSKVQIYLPSIIKAVLPVGRSSASAEEKQQSFKLIALIISKGNFDANNMQLLSDLYGTLFQLLHLRFDKSDMVQEQLLKAIGEVAKRFPSVINNHVNLLDILVYELNKELQTLPKNRKYLVITGCVSALSHCLENFEFSSDSKIASEITVYNSIKALADPELATRRVALRESLQFLTKHSYLFSNKLYSEAKWWHEILIKWFKLGVEDKKVAKQCITKFYTEVVNILRTRNEDYDRDIFQYFLNYFETVLCGWMTEKSMDSYKMEIEISGLGIFAQCFKLHTSEIQIDKILIRVSQIIENIYILNKEPSNDHIYLLPHFVQTLSFIICNQPNLNNSHILSLEHVCVVLIKVLPNLSPAQHYFVVDAFVLAMCQMKKCLNNFEIFLNGVIYQGVLWTCSHEIALEAELFKDVEIITYKNYMNFWNGILSIKDFSKYKIYSIGEDTLKQVVKNIFNELVKTLFLLINRLNLNTKLKDEHATLTSIEVSYEAVQKNDFVIFVNAVDFYQDILKEIDCKLFKPFIITYINQILSKSTKYPFVSGFYKLLVCGLKICDLLNCFQTDTVLREDYKNCFYSLCKFLQHIVWKIKEFKGDLQLACIDVILASPISLVKEILPSCASVFIIIFDIGHSYLKLANSGIDTLEKWFKSLPQDEIEPLLTKVLPSLDTYLRSKSIGTSATSFATTKIRKTPQAIAKRKILVQAEPELFKLQVKILTFLGQLNSNFSLSLLKWENDSDTTVLHQTSYLKIPMPFKEFRMHIYLDQFVPRIVELALYSSNRKIRVFACELLHSVVIVILGAVHPKSKKDLEDLEGLLKVVIYPILKLGCDVDQVIQQLFSLLSIQLMHYYSHPYQNNNPHVQIVIDALTESVSHKTDSSLRDFAGKCIKEYVAWIIKQRNEDDLLKNPINIKVWIRLIHSFSLHPDPFKRLGAAIIFNNTYTILREESRMFNIFWLELLYSFVINLSLAESCEEENICKNQVLSSLNNVMRGLVEKCDLFNTPNDLRRVPYEFGGNLLKHVADWLLKKTGSMNPSCREKCMSMFSKIAPLVTSCNNKIERFIEIYVSSNNEWASLTYETELLRHTTLSSVSSNKKVRSLFRWMHGLLCALDGYIFVFANKLISSNNQSKSSKFFESMQYFLNNLQTSDISNALKLIGNENVFYTSADVEKFNVIKSATVNRTINFFTTILVNKSNISYITTQNFWNQNVCNLICNRIFEPTTLGFNVEDCEEQNTILNLLNLMRYEINSNLLPTNFLNDLRNNLSSYMVNKLVMFPDLNLNIVPFQQRQFMKGLSILQKCRLAESLNISQYVVNTTAYLNDNLIRVSGRSGVTVRLHKTVIEFYMLKLEMALESETEFLLAHNFMCDSRMLTDIEQNCEIEYGFYFFQTFKETLLKCILKNHIVFISEMFNAEKIKYLFKYLKEIEAYLRKQQDPELLRSFVNSCLINMDKSILYFDFGTAEKVQGLDLLNTLLGLSPEHLYNLVQDKPSIIHWVIALLNYEDQQSILDIEIGLNFKSQVLCVIPRIIGPFTAYDEKLRTALQLVKQKYFKNTKSSNMEILGTLKKFFNTIRMSKSVCLLLCAIDYYVGDENISKNIDFELILKDFIMNTTENQQKLLLQSIHQSSFNFNNYTDCQRYLIAKDIFPTLLHYCSYDAFVEFYVMCIKSIKSILSNGQPLEDDPARHVVNKTIAFILIENLYPRIETESFETNTCSIFKAVLSDSPSQLIKLFTEVCLNVFKEHIDASVPKEVFHLYQCHNYNALASIITSTKKNLIFYSRFFKREENKNDILWSNLIDFDKKYKFDIDINKVPLMTKRLVNIRSNIQSDDINTETVKYIESQHLFNSTLSEDVTRFDFSNVLVRSQTDNNRTLNRNSNENRHFVIELEATSINEHECMPTICRLIKHIVENNISPLPKNDVDVKLPQWMEDIRIVLMAERTHVNVKIFLITVIKNTHDIFQSYAKWFLKPILKFIVDGCAGTEINFFIVDLLEMLVSWSKLVTPEDEVELASELLKFSMMISDYSLQSVFKCNLEAIKVIIENWNTYLTIPYDFLFQQLQVEPTSQQRAAGIQLIGVVLANNIAPWRSDNIIPFLKALVKLLDNGHRQVYKPCSETIGMALHFISQDDALKIQIISRFSEFLDKYLSKLSDNKFAYCLQGICLFYPEAADKYLCQMVNKFNYIFGEFKCIYLNIFMARIEALNSVNELSSIDFNKLLSEENIKIQLVTLEFVQKSIPYLKDTYLLSILEEVLKFIKNFNVDCRTATYNIFIVVYSTYYNRKDETFVKIIKICKDALLQGLIDTDLTVQEKIFEFWSSIGDIPIDVPSRILYLLNNLYNPNIEEHFIGYNTYLIINLIKIVEEYSEKLFEFTLYDCIFEEYNLNTNWRMQHISTAPLFVDSLRSQQADVGSIAFNVLRDSFANLEFKPTQFLNYSSSLMFNVNSTKTSNSDDGIFKCPNQVTSKTRYMLGRRFGNTVNAGRHFASLEIKKSIKAEEQRKEKIKQREQNVTICRKYRSGDYPDIEITLSSVLLPLQMLAKHDANLARSLYTSIFTSVVEKIYKDKVIKTDTFINGTTLGINNIFNNSTQFSPNTMAAFLEIILNHKNKIKFDPNTIVSVCQSSGLFAIGSLILEEYIILENEKETPVKRIKGSENGKDFYWVKFAELHKDMEEWDVVNSVFMEKINCHPMALEAINSESKGDWRLAQKYYEQVLSTSINSQEQKDFYYESYFKCYASLAEWDKLPNCIEQVVGSNSREEMWSALWDNDWNQQKLLSWYIKSNLRKTLTKYDDTLFNLINASLQDTDKLEYLKYNFGEEIAMLWLLQNDFSTANFYLNLGITRFLENWLHLNPQFFQLRADKLLNVQSMVDIYSFVNDANKINAENYKDSLDVMLKCWDQTCSSGIESLFQYETKTAYRNQFLSTLKSKCELFLDANDIQNLNTTKFNLHLNLVEKAIEQENYIVARRYIKLCPNPNNNNILEKVKRQFSLSKIAFLIAQCCDDNESKLEKLKTSVEQLSIIRNQQDIFSANDSLLCYLVKSNEHLCDITREVHKIFDADNELFIRKKKDFQNHFKEISLNSSQTLLQFGITNLKKSLHSCETQIENMMNTENLKVFTCMANAYLKLSYTVQDREDFISMFIVSVLRAMKLGSNEGRQLFPCLLNKDIGGCYRETFDTEVKDIPTWMFLGWIPQLLANVDTPKIFSLHNIIIKIATAYPQAITYAYRLSKEKYKFNDDTVGEFGKELVERLNKLCSDNTIDDFLKALASVANPTSILRYYIDKLIKACNSQENFNMAKQQFLNEVYCESSNYKSVTSFRGVIFKKFEKYEKQIKDLTQKSFNGVAFSTELKIIKEQILALKVESSRLVEYSPWLTNFQSANLLYDLEIPGQYTGEKRPLVNYHIKIMGFLSTVSPLKSAKKPVKLTILGNDAKEYPYLVKFGEDLRQDQRIEQIFNLMNNILSQDQQCYTRQLHIDTFQVVPLTSRLGIIEWIGNTMELKKFIGLTESVHVKCFQNYRSWLTKACPGNKSLDEIYNKAYLKYSREDTILNYKLLMNNLPIDALRQAFWNVSINSEHFFTIRHKFIVSYSVMCVSNWLLGIGDRHLSNILIGTQNGQAIGVDFGLAFGSATQILRIPELVPFRLTPQILHLLKPFDEKGLLQKTMIHSLKAFRKKSDILLATMNVFIQEPSLDWLDYARNSSNNENQQHDSKNDEWYPLKKLEHAKLKFEGANSITITIDELKAGHSHNIPLLNRYIELLEGSPQYNFRFGKANNLSVEDQVKCLLDHASDQNLLGRMYYGWEAWI